MKRLLLFLLPSLALHAQQTTLHGTVSVFNSQFETGIRQYVANAQVEEDYGKSQATVTTADGSFTLPIIGINNGEKVFYSVKKAGFEVVNTDALQAVAGQEESSKVFMAPEGSIAKNKLEYYRINREAAEKALTEKLKSLEKEMLTAQSDQTQLKQLKEEYSQMKTQFAKIEETARNLADHYAKVNLDDQSTVFQKSFRYFQRGALDSTLLILDDAKLDILSNQIINESRRNEELVKEYNNRESAKYKIKRETVEALLFKANLHQLKFEFPSVTQTFELLLRLDSSDIQILWSYADFLNIQNQQNKAIHYFEMALRLSKTMALKALFLNNLGNLYAIKNHPEQAEKAFLEAFSIYQRLSALNAGFFESYLATTLNNLGVFYKDKNDLDKAETAYLDVLKIRRHLLETDTQTYQPDLASTLNNLGLLYDSRNEQSKAELVYLEALDIFKKLALKNPELFDPKIAMVKNNLGTLYYRKFEFKNAKTSYWEALGIYKRFARHNPYMYEPDVSMTLNNLGTVFSDVGDFDLAEPVFLEALKIYNRIAPDNSEMYKPEIAITYTNLGNLYYKVKSDYEKAEPSYLEAFDIYKYLMQYDSAKFESGFAMAQSNLGTLYSAQKEYTKSEVLLSNALGIYKRLARNNPAIFEPNVADTETNLGILKLSTEQAEEANIYLIAAYTIYDNLSSLNPEKYELDLARAAMFLGIVNQYFGKKKATKIFFKKCLSIVAKYPDVPLAQSLKESVEEVWQK